MPKRHPVTALVGTYNEAARLPAFLQHARQWADEILIVDKASTDETARIAANAGARVVHRPFSPQGHEDMIANVALAQHDWVFLTTPGEIPTRGFIAAMQSALEQHGDNVDIISIPKKLYSFGIHDPRSPWSVGQQPMLINRLSANISNHVHRNFSLKAGGRAIHLPYSEECHVYHPTHATGAGFLRAHVDYMHAELAGAAKPELLLREALHQLNSQDFGLHDPALFGQECGWKLYWLGCALLAFEKMTGRDVPAEYAAETARRLAAEWS
jgi:hypothetical protein